MFKKTGASALLAVLVVLTLGCTAKDEDVPVFMNPDLSVDDRVNDLIGRMTLDEKVSQSMNR